MNDTCTCGHSRRQHYSRGFCRVEGCNCLGWEAVQEEAAAAPSQADLEISRRPFRDIIKEDHGQDQH